jgi:photosystem II stability/assembly factor-like uncharacterized protein
LLAGIKELNPKYLKIMKIYSVIVLILSFSISLTAQWTPLNSGTESNLHSVYFTDYKIGYVVGDSGIILKTFDSGLNWHKLKSGTKYNLFTVFFQGENTGFIVGDGKTVLKTINGGLDWTNCNVGDSFPSPTYNPIRLFSVYFLDNNNGYVVGMIPEWENGVIYKTIDGGLNWTGMRTPSFSNDGVFFINHDTGYVAGYSNLLRTINAGYTWVGFDPVINADYNICFIDNKIGYVLGFGSINKTIDGGSTWGNIFCEKEELKFICFTDADTGYGVGLYGTIIKTTNGASTWTESNSGTSKNLNSVFFTDKNTGYIVGQYGIILKTKNGGEYTELINKQINENYSTLLYPNPVETILNINIINPTIRFSIIDMQGEILINHQAQNRQIDVSNLKKGIYILKIYNENESLNSKFIKE